MRAVDIAEHRARLLPAICAGRQAHLLVDEGLAAPVAGTHFVYPDIAHHPVHPAVEPRALLPLAARAQGAFDGGLAKIIGLARIARKPGGKAPQAREQCKDAIGEGIGQCRYLSDG